MKLSQTDRLYNLLRSGPLRTDMIQRKVYGSDKLGVARIAARIYDIKQKYDVEIESWRDPKKRTLYWYAMKSKTKFYENKNKTRRQIV